MKKLLVLLMLLCLLPLCAVAERGEDSGVTVALDGAEVFFVPIEGYCLTRESSASVFNRLGLSQREIVPWMEQNDVYALLFSETLDVQIQIVAHPSTEMDFDDQTQFGLDMMCEAVENLYVTEGYDVESAEMCHTPNGHSYVRTTGTYIYEDGYVENMIEFFTCQSGYSVYVVMFTLEGAPTEEQIILCESVVDSLWLSENPVEGQPVELTAEGISVLFYLPDGVTCLTKDSSEAAWYGLPEGFVSMRQKELKWNQLQGVIMSPDAKWEIQWEITNLGGGGDLDDISDADADDFRQRTADGFVQEGFNVANSSCDWIGPHRYVMIRYSYIPNGRLVHIEEYYTRQNGWNITVRLYGYGDPAPEEAHDLMEDILKNQRITVYEQGAK